MTQENTFVLALRLQRLAAPLATRVRVQPRIKLGVHLLAAVADVLSRYVRRAVGSPAVGAAPAQRDILLRLILLLLFQHKQRILDCFHVCNDKSSFT